MSFFLSLVTRLCHEARVLENKAIGGKHEKKFQADMVIIEEPVIIGEVESDDSDWPVEDMEVNM